MQDKLQQDLKQAQLSKDETKVSTLRMLLSELNYARIQKGEELEEKEIITVVQKELKKRKEGAEGFRKGDKEEQALKEEAEAQVLTAYLPAQISDEELTKVVEESITNIGASSLQDMGKVMSLVMAKVGQGADGGRVSSLVKEKLQHG